VRCRCLGAQKLLRTADLTVVIGVPALAVNQGWWFRSAGAPKPQSDMSVITAGRSAGIDWTLTAYATQNKEAGLRVGRFRACVSFVLLVMQELLSTRVTTELVLQHFVLRCCPLHVLSDAKLRRPTMPGWEHGRDSSYKAAVCSPG
jgi:hypothetical protein